MTRPCRIIGHRGARGLFPENTLAGFEATLALGVDGLELDVGMTADGVVVVSHDPALNPDHTRDASGAWLDGRGPLIASLTVAELQAYDVGALRPGSAYAALFPRQAARDGERIPRLETVLRLRGPASADPSFVIELKTFPADPGRAPGGERLAEAVAAVADAVGATARITVEGFDWRGPRWLRRVRPDVRLAWLTRAETVRDADIWWGGPHPSDFSGSVPRAVAAEGGPIWAPDHHDLTPDLVAEAHGLGLLVMPWTVNEVADMRRMIGWGVDGMVTDRPDRAKRVVAQTPA
jgi:glycerophosphoryl diester phosphodiesterase